MATAAPAPGEQRMSASDWNAEASRLVCDLEASQKEVAALLTSQAAQEKELEGIKEACDSELAELQEQTWRLQMFAELEKMKGLISQLRPIHDDAVPPADRGSADASPSPPPPPPPLRAGTAAMHPVDAGGRDDDCSGDEVVGGGGPGGEAAREAALAGIDSELAALVAAIRVAKDEVGGLMASKQDLQQELAGLLWADGGGHDGGGGSGGPGGAGAQGEDEEGGGA